MHLQVLMTLTDYQWISNWVYWSCSYANTVKINKRFVSVFTCNRNQKWYSKLGKSFRIELKESLVKCVQFNRCIVNSIHVMILHTPFVIETSLYCSCLLSCKVHNHVQCLSTALQCYTMQCGDNCSKLATIECTFIGFTECIYFVFQLRLDFYTGQTHCNCRKEIII